MVPDLFLALIASFFKNRSQFVKVGTTQSAMNPVLSGVCQGTVLGPYLFNVVVHNILQNVQLSSGSHVAMYANDLVYLKCLQNPASSIDEAQQDLDILTYCYLKLGLSINPKKSDPFGFCIAMSN